MAIPTFNDFSFNDSNFITERIVFKGYADRDTIRAKLARREGVKLLNTEFGEKEVTLEGVVVASSASELRDLLDGMKRALTQEDAELALEEDRSFVATVKSLVIPDEHYSQTKSNFEVTFLCSNPFALSASQSVIIPVTSGLFTISGSITISGTLFTRPVFYYFTNGSGKTLITKLEIYHLPTGEITTVSGFGGGTSLGYGADIIVDYNEFSVTEDYTDINYSGTFPRWDVGINRFTFTSTGRAFPGGEIYIDYQPRWL